jgi:hypothetical protein
MATYKVLQDIEAEDKLVGPLTFQQFVYAGIAALNFYLAFLVISKGAAPVAAVFIPIGGLAAFFAWPFSRDQPTEVWALAKIKFLIQPRKRVWDQSGMKELVTITVPKKVERHLTNGLSENEVKSRLQALADTIDSRGWAIKNVNVSMMGQPALVPSLNDSDRLIGAGSLPQPVEDTVDVKSSDDILDVQNNPVARHFDTMIEASARAHRQEVIQKMQSASTVPPASAQAPAPSPLPATPPTPPQASVQSTAQSNNYWFLNEPTQQASAVPQNNVTFNTQVVEPGTAKASLPVTAAVPTQDEESFIRSHKNEPAFSPNMHGHLHVIQPLSAQTAGGGQPMPQPMSANPMLAGQAASVAKSAGASGAQVPVSDDRANMNMSQGQVTQARDTAILDLARNDDLNVATIAREAHKRTEPPADEVVISLH